LHQAGSECLEASAAGKHAVLSGIATGFQTSPVTVRELLDSHSFISVALCANFGRLRDVAALASPVRKIKRSLCGKEQPQRGKRDRSRCAAENEFAQILPESDGGM